MSKMIQINAIIESNTTRVEKTVTRAVLVSGYDIECLWQTGGKDKAIVRLCFSRGNDNYYTEELAIDDAEFERLSKILTAKEKED